MLLLFACSLCELVVTASILDEESPSITGSPDKRLDWSKSRADYNEMKRRTTWLQESVLAIDEQAPNFSGDAVINGDITTYACPWMTCIHGCCCC